MEIHINYLTDSQGNKISVQIPFAQWSEFVKGYNRLRQYTKLKNNLKISFNEVAEMESGKARATTLSEFLNEC